MKALALDRIPGQTRRSAVLPLSTSTPVIPALSRARTRVPWPADPTLADTFVPVRSASVVAAESGFTTTIFSAPLGLYPVIETISVFASGLACVLEPLISIG